jgi:hypothetical protein
VVGLLDEAATLIESSDMARTAEQKRAAVLRGKTMTETVAALRDDLQNFIKQMPRCDFPKHDATLLKRYLEKTEHSEEN